MVTTRAKADRNADFYSEKEAAIYDGIILSKTPDDLTFWCGLAIEFGHGNALELGCGTMRVGIAVAKNGVKVFGVDRSSAMLARANAKIKRLEDEVASRITLALDDIRYFYSDFKFRFAYLSLNVLMELPGAGDVLATLKTIRRCLVPRGFVAFEIGRWRPCLADSHCKGKIVPYAESISDDGVTVTRELELLRIEDRIVEIRFHTQEKCQSGGRHWTSQLVWRCYTDDELRELAYISGFTIVSVWSGWKKEHATPDDLRRLVLMQAS